MKKKRAKSTPPSPRVAPPEARPGRGLRLVRRETLKERIYDEMRHALQAGKFEPGESITVKLLADELGAGTMPIRETLQRLVAEGALASLPSGRVRVPLFTPAEFDEIKEVRLRLEGMAAYHAAVLMDSASLQEINANYQTLAKCAKDPKSSEVVHRNYQFHFAIYGVARMRHLLSIIDSLWLRVSPLLSIPFHSPAHARAEYLAIHEENHIRLLGALRDRDGRAAEASIREIILASAGWYHRHYRFAAQSVSPSSGAATAAREERTP